MTNKWANATRTTPNELKKAIQVAQSNGLTQMAILHHWLGYPSYLSLDHTAFLLQDAIILGVDVEWWEHGSEQVTELGFSQLDPHLMKDWRSPWFMLRQMVTEHVRIKETAHLVNSKSCTGYPDKFAFGKTRFIDRHVAPFMLKEFFCHRDRHGSLRPVILLGHAIDNDVQMIKDRFGLDINDLNVVVATIDTQVLAVEFGFVPSGRKLGLSKLLQRFNIVEEHLHNAGNDIVCTMVTALLMTMPHSPNSYPEFYNHLKMHLSVHSNPKWGTATFCVGCNSHEHTAENCNSVLRCAHCLSCNACKQSGYSHITTKCLEMNRKCSAAYQASLRYAIPCPSCIESKFEERHNEDFAYSHKQENCPHLHEIDFEVYGVTAADLNLS